MALSKVSPGIFAWTRPVPREQWDASNPALLDAALAYEEIEQRIGYTFRDKGFLLAAFTHGSLPDKARIVPCSLRPMDHLGDALLKQLVSAKLYGCLHPLSPRALHDARKHVDSNYSFGLAAARHGFHRFLRSGSPALSEAVVAYVRGLENADYPGNRSHVPPKPLADVFEALAAAIYLDSHQDLAAMWRSMSPMLRPHIDHEIASVAAASALYFF